MALEYVARADHSEAHCDKVDGRMQSGVGIGFPGRVVLIQVSEANVHVSTDVSNVVLEKVGSKRIVDVSSILVVYVAIVNPFSTSVTVETKLSVTAV